MSTIVEKRVAAPTRTAAARAPGGAAGAGDDPAPGPRRRRRLVVLVLVALLLGGAAGYWFFLGPGAQDPDAVATEPEPGEVLTIDPVNLNLADGRYLRLGLALQLVEGAQRPDPARALDLAIALFSGRPISEVMAPDGREELKSELVRQLGEVYDGEVIDVYFTDYVTQ